jgi:hypothetical protein
LALLLALLLLIQVSPRDAAPQRDPPPTAVNASISGRVYSAATGTPVRGALVVLAPSSTPFEVTSFRVPAEVAKSGVSTDAAGRFQIPGVASGVYYVVAFPSSYGGRHLAAGYGAVRGNDPGKAIRIEKDARVPGVGIALPAALAIEGRVLDQTGEPLARTTVFAARVMPGSDTAARVPSVPMLTDDLGRYRIYGLEPGTYVVATDGRGGGLMFVEQVDGRTFTSVAAQRESEPFTTTFHPSALAESEAQRIRLTAQDVTGIDITVLRARRLQVSGVVLDSQGAPASTNVLLVRDRALGIFPQMPRQTDSQGRFFIGALDPGEYRLLVGGGLAAGLTSVNGRTEFAEMQMTIVSDMPDVVVMTQPGIGLAGQVVFAEGPPQRQPTMRIAIARPETSSIGKREIVTTMDDDLRFYASDVFGPQLVRVTGLPPGWAVKAVTLAGTDITDVPTVFKQEHDGQLHVVLSSRASTLEGVVRAAETSAPGEATVYVFSEDHSTWRISSPRTHKSDTGENGKFSIGGLTAGRYYAIAVAREGFRPVTNPGEAFFDLLSREAMPFAIGDDERRTLDLRLWRWPE